MRLIPLITFIFLLSMLPFQAAASNHTPTFPDYAEAGVEEEIARTPMDFFILGCKKLKEGKLKEALIFTNEAIRLSESDDVSESDKLSKENLAIAYSNRAILLNKFGNIKGSLYDFNKSIDIDPYNAYTYTIRGELWEHLGQNNLAIADYNQSGRIWSKKGRYDKAIISLGRAIKLDPDHPGINNNMAWLLSICSDDRVRNGDQALKFASKAVKIEEAPHTLDTLAAAYAELGRFQEAIETQERAIELLKQEGGTEGLLAEFEKRLSHYKAGIPWRE